MLQINLLVLPYSYQSISASLISFILVPVPPPVQIQSFSHGAIVFCLPFPSCLVIYPRDLSLWLHLLSLSVLPLLRLVVNRETEPITLLRVVGGGPLCHPILSSSHHSFIEPQECQLTGYFFGPVQLTNPAENVLLRLLAIFFFLQGFIWLNLQH